MADLWSNLAPRRPALCPEIELALVERHSPLGVAIKRDGLWAVHESFAGLVAPPHWAYAWASGIALARHLLDHPQLVAGRTVIDAGLGSGIVAIAAALAGAARVRGFDRDPTAVEAALRNATANRVEIDARRGDAADLAPACGEIVLAADVFYEDGPFTSSLTRWAESGGGVLYAEPGRGVLRGAPGETLALVDARTEPDIETVGPVVIRWIGAARP